MAVCKGCSVLRDMRKDQLLVTVAAPTQVCWLSFCPRNTVTKRLQRDPYGGTVRTRSSAERVRRASFSIPVGGKGLRGREHRREDGDGAEGSRGEGQPTQRGPARRGASPLVREALRGQIGRDVVRLASDPAAAPAGQRRGRSAPIARRTARRRAGRAHAARRRSRSHRGWRWQSPSSRQRC